VVLKNSGTSPLLEYSVGDHIGIFPETCPDLVESLLLRLKNLPEDLDAPVELQFLKRKESHGMFLYKYIVLNLNSHYNFATYPDVVKDWMSHDQLPTSCSIRTLLTRFLNVNLPASLDILRYFTRCTDDEEELRRLQDLIDVNIR